MGDRTKAVGAEVSPEVLAWLEWVALTSIPLRRLDADGRPCGSASGCLIDYHGRRFLLTAAHAVSMHATGWVIELESSGRGTEIFTLPTMNYLGEMTLGVPKIDELDVCCCEVPPNLESFFRMNTPQWCGERERRHIFSTDLHAIPLPSDVFAFAGHVHLEMHGDEGIAGDLTVYPGLSYVRTEGHAHVFKMPVEHPGHEHFHGCSGGPIVNYKRQAVALVSSGNDTDHTVRGVSLQRCRPLIEFLASHTAPCLALPDDHLPTR